MLSRHYRSLTVFDALFKNVILGSSMLLISLTSYSQTDNLFSIAKDSSTFYLTTAGADFLAGLP